MEKFPAGKIVMTIGIGNRIDSDPEFSKFVQNSLTKHFAGDWGEIDKYDWNANDTALVDEERLLSFYIHESLRVKIWIITEADRSSTMVLFPNEY